MRKYQLVVDNRTVDLENGPIGFSFRGRSFRIGSTHREAAVSFLDALSRAPVEAEEALRGAGSGGLQAIAYARSLLGALSVGGWLRQECSHSNAQGQLERLLTLEPIAPTPGRLRRSSCPPLGLETAIQLKRSVMFALRDNEIIMEAGDVPYIATFCSPRAWDLVFRTATRAPIAELQGTISGLEDTAVLELLRMLLEVGFLTTEPQEGPPLWSAWEMLFHARSRVGRSVGGYGGTYRFKGILDPTPGLPPRRGGKCISLPTPDLKGHMTLVEASEARRSVRQQNAEDPITVDQLAALLYRVQRTRAVRSNGNKGDVLSRPYPSGGSLYELEIYPLVTSCVGLEAGVYHYRSESHELEKVAALDDRACKLAGLMGHTTLMGDMPQVVLLITARFPRVMWKYEGVPYSIILKNVGVLYHALMLHATDLGLASCPVGGGDSDVVADILETDYFIETTVGEVILGSMPDPEEAMDVRD